MDIYYLLVSNKIIEISYVSSSRNQALVNAVAKSAEALLTLICPEISLRKVSQERHYPPTYPAWIPLFYHFTFGETVYLKTFAPQSYNFFRRYAKKKFVS